MPYTRDHYEHAQQSAIELGTTDDSVVLHWLADTGLSHCGRAPTRCIPGRALERGSRGCRACGKRLERELGLEWECVMDEYSDRQIGAPFSFVLRNWAEHAQDVEAFRNHIVRRGYWPLGHAHWDQAGAHVYTVLRAATNGEESALALLAMPEVAPEIEQIRARTQPGWYRIGFQDMTGLSGKALFRHLKNLAYRSAAYGLHIKIAPTGDALYLHVKDDRHMPPRDMELVAGVSVPKTEVTVEEAMQVADLRDFDARDRARKIYETRFNLDITDAGGFDPSAHQMEHFIWYERGGVFHIGRACNPSHDPDDDVHFAPCLADVQRDDIKRLLNASSDVTTVLPVPTVNCAQCLAHLAADYGVDGRDSAALIRHVYGESTAAQVLAMADEMLRTLVPLHPRILGDGINRIERGSLVDILEGLSLRLQGHLPEMQDMVAGLLDMLMPGYLELDFADALRLTDSLPWAAAERTLMTAVLVGSRMVVAPPQDRIEHLLSNGVGTPASRQTILALTREQQPALHR